MKLTEYILSALFLFFGVNAASLKWQPLTPSEPYTHSAIVDEDDESLYQVFWKLDNTLEEIQFEVHCRTTGWVGIGLSPNGGMPGSDIAIGWIDRNGVKHLKDTHATRFAAPTVDAKQDWFLIDAAEANGYTMIKMKRKFDTCDRDEDFEIKEETNYLIFAWNSNDPPTGNGDWSYHGANRRIKVDFLRIYKDETTTEEDIDAINAIKVNFTLNNLYIRPKKTFYFCQFVQFPQYAFDTQMIRYDIIVDKPNKDILHHIVIYDCPPTTNLDTIGLEGRECGSVSVPNYMGACLASPIIMAWGTGGQKTFSFPKDTGLPHARSVTKKYALIEFHYDNPTLDATRFDNSGLRFYFTPNLRKYDIGVLTLGTDTRTIDLTIPPGIEDLKISSVCYPECSQKFIPTTGIKVFSGFLHTHLAGREVRTKLVRNNRVVKHILDNPRYDFNYQFNIEIEPVTLNKGDMLITECVYTSTDRQNVTFWGHSTDEEMCFDFVYYYPKMKNFDKCISKPSADAFCNFYKGLAADNLIPPVICSPTNINQSIREIENLLKSQVTFSSEFLRRFKEFYADPLFDSASCGSIFAPTEAILNLLKVFPRPTELTPPTGNCPAN